MVDWNVNTSTPLEYRFAGSVSFMTLGLRFHVPISLGSITLCLSLLSLMGCGNRQTASEKAHNPDAVKGTKQLTGELGRVASISYYLREYVQHKDGRCPTSWEELESAVKVEGHSERWGAIKQDYVFVKDGPKLPYDKNPTPVGQVVVIGTKAIKEAGKPTLGRYVFLRIDPVNRPDVGRPGHPDDGVLFPPVWVPEHRFQKLIRGEALAADAAPRHINLTLEVSNPKAQLLPGEPLCIRVRAVGMAETIPDEPQFVFEVTGPTGVHSIDFLEDNLLVIPEEGRAVVHYATTDEKIGATFHAALLFFDRRFGEWTEPRLLTAKPGRYSIKVSEKTSGCTSAVHEFTVADATGRESQASALFTAKSGIRHFMFPDADFSDYENLVRHYSESRFAGYAAWVLAEAKLSHAGKESSRQRYEPVAAEAEAYAEQSLKLNFRSIFEFRALVLKARCVGVRHDFAAQETILKQILEQYGDTSCLGEVQAARELLDGGESTLIVRLRSPDATVRLAAIDRVKQFRELGGAALPALIDLMGDPVPEVGTAAFLASRDLGGAPTRAVSELLADLKSPDPTVRRRIAWELEALHPPPSDVVDALLRSLEDKDKIVRSLAAWALVDVTGPDARKCVSPLLNVLSKDADPVTRRHATMALSTALTRDDKAAIPPLMNALHDEDKTVRLLAAGCLAKFRSEAKGAIPLLEAILDEFDPAVRPRVEESLKTIRGQ